MKSELKRELKTVIILIICFSIYLFLLPHFKVVKISLDKITHFGLLSYFLTYVILGIPIFIGTYLINKKAFKALGVSSNIIKPFGFAWLVSAPMFLGGLLFFKINTEIHIEKIIAGSIIIALIEEVFYRGFLFGQIFNNTRLGFIPSILGGAAIFAMGHLYQSQDFFELIGIFSVSFMGAILFAWLYVEWNYNLWAPIFLHALMNLAWHIFEMDDTALGGMLPNILRGLTIILAIGLTIIYKRKNGLDLIINKASLFKKAA